MIVVVIVLSCLVITLYLIFKKNVYGVKDKIKKCCRRRNKPQTTNILEEEGTESMESEAQMVVLS